MKLSLFEAGYCTHPEHVVIRGGKRQDIHFPAMFALIEHPKRGAMLFDTGYSQAFFEATSRLPYSIYARITPVFLQEHQVAVQQLALRGLEPSDIETIFISHFHADHIAALIDFPKAQFVFMPSAFAAIKGKTGLAALRKAFLPDLLPKDFQARAKPLDLSMLRPLPPEYHPFKVGIDVLGDESLIAVELPGHAAGQMGLFVQTTTKAYFLVADAAWLTRSYQENRLPRRIANLVFDDASAYKETLSSIHTYYLSHKDVHIIPSHCQSALDRFK